MKDIKIKITITNALTKAVEQDFTDTVVDFADLNEMHRGYCEAYPDSHVNFVMEDGFIAGVPLNMQLDQERYEKGLITWNEYVAKWYPNLV